MPSVRNSIWAAALAVTLVTTAFAQTSVDQAGLAKLTAPTSLPTPAMPANINSIPAKKLFGSEKLPANLAARAIGNYSRGCLSGAQALPVNGPAWQVMRTSRNRNWGHPSLLNLIERLASDAKQTAGWNGLLVGDISQPRGGPMLTGHASHQIGLDADVWFTPMPDHVLTSKERENMAPVEMVKDHQTLKRE